MAWPRSAVCDQFICATGVSALALALAFAKVKKTLACRAATQKKRHALGRVGSRWGPSRPTSLGLSPFGFLGTASWPLFFFLLLLPWLPWGLSAQPLTSLLLSSFSSLSSCIGAERREVHMRRIKFETG
ncbi:hypothetical protein V8C34DRAFT_230555 [Trichoderma compactum]